MATVAENEKAYRVLKFSMTRDALRQEVECPHSVVAYQKGSAGKWAGPHPTICICTECRMEWHARWHEDPKRSETIERRFIEPRVVGVKTIYQLRARDNRAIIMSDRYDAHPPKRKPRKGKA